MIKNKLLVLKNLTMATIIQSLLKIILAPFPLREDKFFCISMNGNNYGDNIKVLSDYIHDIQPNSNIVWGFSPNLIHNVECKYQKAQIFTLKYYYHILSSKYILSNFAMDFCFLSKRKKQIVLETWHGTPLKKIGYDMYKTEKQSFLYTWFGVDRIKNTVEMTDILISGSKFMTNIFREKFLYQKEIYEVGTPRNDIFYKENIHITIAEKIKSQYGIPMEKKIILYAPTFRQGGSFEFYDIDLPKIKCFLENKFACEYAILLRLHPSQINRDNEFSQLFKFPTINTTFYPDMQELLCATDILITDYSSSIFDYMLLKRPIIMYVPDKNTYSRGFYFNINELPTIIISNNNEIETTLCKYDWNGINKKIDTFLSKIGNKEHGCATEMAYNILMTKGKA